MDSSSHQGMKLENEIKKLVSISGWSCVCEERRKLSNGNYFFPDIILSFNGEEYGIVELFIEKHKPRMPERIRMFRRIIQEYKPKIFIATDGTLFFLSIDGSEFQTLSYMPGPHSYLFSEMNISTGGNDKND